MYYVACNIRCMGVDRTGTWRTKVSGAPTKKLVCRESPWSPYYERGGEGEGCVCELELGE